MLESTNALMGALIAVMKEIDRCDTLIAKQELSETEEEELGDYLNQLQEALADLGAVYETRRLDHPALLPLPQFREHIKSEHGQA
jgi:hypothetical protein